jgi:hypothetical protein
MMGHHGPASLQDQESPSTPIVATRLPYKGRIVKPFGGASSPLFSEGFLSCGEGLRPSRSRLCLKLGSVEMQHREGQPANAPALKKRRSEKRLAFHIKTLPTSPEASHKPPETGGLGPIVYFF